MKWQLTVSYSNRIVCVCLITHQVRTFGGRGRFQVVGGRWDSQSVVGRPELVGHWSLGHPSSAQVCLQQHPYTSRVATVAMYFYSLSRFMKWSTCELLMASQTSTEAKKKKKKLPLVVEDEENVHETCSFVLGPLPPSVYLDMTLASLDKGYQAFPFVFTDCKWSKTEWWEALWARLGHSMT